MTPPNNPPAWHAAEAAATWWFERPWWRKTYAVDAWVFFRFIAIVGSLVASHQVRILSVVVAGALLAEGLWYQTGLVVRGGTPDGSVRLVALTLVSYVSTAISFAVFFAAFPQDFKPAVGRFDAAYFSFVTIGTIGFGDVVPTTRVLKGAVVAEHLVGLFYLAVLLVVIVGLARKRFDEPA